MRSIDQNKTAHPGDVWKCGWGIKNRQDERRGGQRGRMLTATSSWPHMLSERQSHATRPRAPLPAGKSDRRSPSLPLNKVRPDHRLQSSSPGPRTETRRRTARHLPPGSCVLPFPSDAILTVSSRSPPRTVFSTSMVFRPRPNPTPGRQV